MILYFVYADLKSIERKIKMHYVNTLNDRAEEVLRVLYEEFKKLPNHLKWSQEVRDNFNRALGGAYHNGINLTVGKERKHAQYCYRIARTYFAILPQWTNITNFDESCILDFLLLIEEMQSQDFGNEVGSMFDCIFGENKIFEEKYKQCIRTIEDLQHIVD
jgi:hypothetical protein